MNERKVEKLITSYFLRVLTVLFLTSNIDCLKAYSNPFEDKVKNNRNVIIICLDTLRADHIGCYGYSRATTPNIDKLAKKGIIFEWAITQANATLPSHASLFTSKYVYSHKVKDMKNRLSEDQTTLAQVLGKNGYKTAAFICNANLLSPRYGLNKGFDTYSFREEDDRTVSFEKTMPAALEWIKQNRDSKFFVFLHSNDIHQPYHSIYENFFDPHYKGRLDNEYFEEINALFKKNNLARTPREIKHIIAHYDGGIKYADSFIPELMQKLADWALLDKTIIILLSDHGEMLANRSKRFCHNFSLHDEEVRVPLIILHPEIKKSMRIKKQVQLIDIMPTVFDFLDIKNGIPAMEGRSLVNLIEGQNGGFDKYAYAECVNNENANEGLIKNQVMVRTSLRKLIGSMWKVSEADQEMLPKTITSHDPNIISIPNKDRFELYNLQKDPKENRNIIDRKDKRGEEELLNKLLSSYNIPER